MLVVTNLMQNVNADPRESDRLPWMALLALAMTGFTAILTETLPAGLLPQIADGLAVSTSLAVQFVTFYALGSLIAAIPLTVLTQRWRRKPTLLAAIAGFLIFNTITALSGSYPITLTARFFAGVAAGLSWAILAGYARRMVVDTLKGQALAVAMVGTPIALSLGVPIGTFLGAALGWRTAFGLMSATTLALIYWVVLAVPDYAGQQGQRRRSVREVFLTPGIIPILGVILTWMAAHNILYTYIAPFAARARLDGSTGLLLLGFGLMALAGIWIVGLLVDRMLRNLVLVSLAAFAATTLLLGVAGSAPAVAIGGVLVWGLTFGGAATLLQTAAADVAGDGVDLANAMITTVWNGAIATGGIVGGLLLGSFGVEAFFWVMAALIMIALCITGWARIDAFTPGSRATA